MLIVLLIGIATFLVYGNILGNYFLNDDFGRILSLQHLQDLSFAEAFYLLFRNSYHVYYRPFTNISFYALRVIFGLEPLGYYVSSLICHAAATFALYGCYSRFYAGKYEIKYSLWILISVGFFLLNPRHVEAVSYIHDNENVICGLFYFIGFWAFLGLCQRTTSGGWWVFALSFMGSLLGKEMGITLPVTCLAYYLIIYRWQSANDRPSVWKDPFIFKVLIISASVFAFYMALRYAALGEFVGGFGPTASLDFSVGRMARTLVQAMVAMLLPNDIYFLTWAAQFFRENLGIFAVVLFIGGILGLWLLSKVASRMMVFGLAWICISLIPVLNNGIGVDILTGGRYLYIPMAGMAILLAEIITRISIVRLRYALVVVGLFFYGSHTHANNVAMGRISHINEQFLKAIGRVRQDNNFKAVVVVPGMYRGMYILPSGFTTALEVMYGERGKRILQDLTPIITMQINDLDSVRIKAVNEEENWRLDFSGGGVLWKQELYRKTVIDQFKLQFNDRIPLNMHGDFIAGRAEFLFDGIVLLPDLHDEFGGIQVVSLHR